MAQADNMPVYAVTANRQLEAIARGRSGSRGALARIQGFGKRSSRYGDAILGLLTAFLVG
jgi:ribonuclease D